MADCATSIPNIIPQMTDPLGKYWDQPKDIRSAPMDDDCVLLTRDQFNELSDYSRSIPSGVYPGKCWRATYKGGARYMLWYGPFHTDGKTVDILHRRIIIGWLKTDQSTEVA